MLKHRCGNLTAIQEQKVRSLSISQLESLGEALLDFPYVRLGKLVTR
ncbi:DUF4351 domain-containing protein [Dolichospermum circinale]|nr:DUF4351 domain-containing protein [Dolichospermum circinale]MDB9465276.1 DUF4351 domain-containing protein [Dolichospermum circinale CS-539/09]MDB9470280.1 DUF4351 domain-containing protein [Dolichospermum circinale CS-539]